MMKIRRINLVGGPGCSKSTAAHWLFAAIKTRLRRYEPGFVVEHVKEMAYEGRHPTGYDQVHLLAKQLHDEEYSLKSCDVIVCESPLLLCASYAIRYQTACWKHIQGISMDFEAENPSFNIFLKRPEIFDERGRYQKKAEAIELDLHIRKVFEDNGVELHDFNFDDVEGMFNAVKNALTDSWQEVG